MLSFSYVPLNYTRILCTLRALHIRHIKDFLQQDPQWKILTLIELQFVTLAQSQARNKYVSQILKLKKNLN